MAEVFTSTAKSPTALDIALRRAGVGFAIAMALSFAINLLMLVSPIYMLQTYDRILTSGSRPTLFYLTLITVVALFALGAFDALRAAILSRTAAWSAAAARDAVVRGTFWSGLGNKDATSQPVRDLKQVQSFLGGQGVTPLFDAPWAPGFIIVIWMMHPLLGWLATGSAVLLAVTGIVNEWMTRKGLREASQNQLAAYDMLDSALKNAEVVDAMGMRGAVMRRWNALDDKAVASGELAGDVGGGFAGFTKFIRFASQMAVLGLGALLVLDGELSSGGMIAASILLGRALAPVEQLIGSWKSWVTTWTAYNRTQGLLRSAPGARTPFPLPAPTGRLSLRGVAYRPTPDLPPVLANISFDVQPGECLGVIGSSAAGKTTLCRLITGVYAPTIGEIRLDDAELSFWDKDQLGQHIGYLPQEVELFTASIAINIARMGQPDPERVMAAAKMANVHEMILHMPQGYDTVFRPGGKVISAGQRQRIGLARAIYGGPKMLVLDEPNSNLDGTGEEALQNTIRALKAAGCAVVIVAHRREALVHADKLVIIRNGQMAAYGPAQEVYRQLAEEFAQRRSGPKIVEGGAT